MEVTRNKKVFFDNGSANMHYCHDFCDAHQICKQCLGSTVPVNTRDRDIYCICRKFKKDIGTPEARMTGRKANKAGFESRMARTNAGRNPTSPAAPPLRVATASAAGAELAAGINRMNTTN
jgi:hypothetical protein